MPVRPAVAETTQLGVETTRGTAVPANVRLGSLAMDASYAIAAASAKPTGYKFATIAEVTTDAANVKVSGKPTYTEAPYPFASLLGAAAISTPTNGVKTRDWLFRPSTNDSDAPVTFSLEQGNNGLRAQFTKYALLTELNFQFSRRNGCSWDGSAIAQRLHDDKVRYITIVATGGTFTITVGGQTTGAIAYNAVASAVQTALEALSNVAPGDVAVSGGPGGTAPYRIYFTGVFKDTAMPAVSVDGASLTGGTPSAALGRMRPTPIEYVLNSIQGPHLDLYLADTYAGLDTAQNAGTRFTEGFGGSWKLGSRFEGAYFIDSSQESWSEHVEMDPSGQLTLTAAAGDVGMGLINKIRTTNTAFLRIFARGPLIESVTPDYYHTLRIDTALKITGISEKKVENSVVAYDFTGDFSHDATWGRAVEVFVRTNLASLGTAAL